MIIIVIAGFIVIGVLVLDWNHERQEARKAKQRAIQRELRQYGGY